MSDRDGEALAFSQRCCGKSLTFSAQAWAYVFPVSLLRIPYSLLVAVCWAIIVYYPVGLSPDPATCASGLSR